MYHTDKPCHTAMYNSSSRPLIECDESCYTTADIKDHIMKLRECCTQEHLQEAVSQLLHTHRRLHTQPSAHRVSGCAWTQSYSPHHMPHSDWSLSWSEYSPVGDWLIGQLDLLQITLSRLLLLLVIVVVLLSLPSIPKIFIFLLNMFFGDNRYKLYEQSFETAKPSKA